MRPLQNAEKESITRELLLDPAKPEAFPAYFRLYDSLFCPSDKQSTIIQMDYPVFNTHADIVKCAHRLRSDPRLTRQGLASALSLDSTISENDRKTAIQSVVRVSLMLDCFKGVYSRNFQEEVYQPVQWKETESLVSYVERAIPRCDIQHGGFQVHKHKRALKAWKLERRYGLQLRPTDNIMEHLLYNPGTQELQIFHHTAYLKAHLKRSRELPLEEGASQSLKLGTLPPQLLLETLHSIHFILFPVSDASGKSMRCLKRLIRKHNFDPNAEWFEGAIREDIPTTFRYQYWNSRIEQLYMVVKNPPPANRLISWIERHTSERNALTVAIVGLFLSAFFGLLTCIIGAAQLAIAVLQWKQPRDPS
ncbi:hypothetical protein BJX99DRAFT_272410 [Aspergillus californicus]